MQSCLLSRLIWQVFQNCRVFSVNICIGIVVQLYQLSQRGHAGVMINQHHRQMGRFALDATRAAHWCQKLQVFDIALSPGCSCGLTVNSLLDTAYKRKRGVKILYYMQYLNYISFSLDALTFAGMELSLYCISLLKRSVVWSHLHRHFLIPL